MTNDTKQTGQETIMNEFKPKKSNILITFKTEAREQAIAARQLRGMEVAKDFFGPEFNDIKGYSLNGPYLVVQLHEDTQYVYPMNDVARLKLFYTE